MASRYFLALVALVALKCADCHGIIFHFDEPDYSSLSRNNTRCSTTKLSFGKETLLHTWDLTGFFKYMKYLKRFEESFEVKTEDVSFKSDNIDGKWMFKFSKQKHSASGTSTTARSGLPEDGAATAGSLGGGGSSRDSPMKISAIYSYDAREQRKINFGIFLTIVHDNRELVLPLQKSSEPVVSQMRSYSSSSRVANPQYFTFSYHFAWPDVHEEFGQMMASKPTSPPGSTVPPPPNQSENSQDLTLRFFVTAYYPKDPVFSTGDSCGDSLTASEQMHSKPWGNHVRPPPFIKHMVNMLHDVKYADMYLQVGGQEIPAHRIILANASPILSSLIYNETFMGPVYDYNKTDLASTIAINPMPVIHVDDDIESKTVEELMRYIYTGKVENMPESAMQLLIASDRYGLLDLKRMSERIVVSQVKTHNSIDMYKLGMQVGSQKLSRKAFDVMKANKAKIVSQTEEFRKLSAQHPSLMFELFLAS